MKAKKVSVLARGGTENIGVVDYDIPEPDKNEVRIKVEFAGLSFADLMLRKTSIPGLPKVPFTPGADLAGVIDMAGVGTGNFQRGDRVAVLMMSDLGAQAQYVCVDKNRVMKIPDDIPSDKAVCLLINYLTAFNLLSTFNNEISVRDAVVLVHGGSGGVGSALIQLAVSQNIKVLSTCSKKNIPFIEGLGAQGIDYCSENFDEYINRLYSGKIDAVFDPIGGDYLRRSIKILKKGGCYIGYGFQKDIKNGMIGMVKAMCRFFLMKLLTFDKKMIISQLNDKSTSDNMRNLEILFSFYRNGKISPVVSDVFPFSAAAQAHLELENGERNGKILIRMTDT